MTQFKGPEELDGSNIYTHCTLILTQIIDCIATNTIWNPKGKKRHIPANSGFLDAIFRCKLISK